MDNKKPMKVIRCMILILLQSFAAISIYAGSADPEERILFQQHFSHAKDMLKEQKCVQIDVTASYDSLGADLELRWDLGDGNKAKGFMVKHCYEQYGMYKAVLNIHTKDGKIFTPNEIMLDVSIKREARLFLNTPDTLPMDSLFTPMWSVSELIGYNIEKTVVDYGDGAYSNNDDINHKYAIPGIYNFRILMILSATDGEFYMGIEKKIYVQGFNIIGSQISAYFENFRDSSQVAYLDEPIRLSIVDTKDNQLIESRIIAPEDRYCQLVPAGIKPLLFIWKGNQFLRPVPITPINDSSESFILVLEGIGKSMNSPPIALEAIFFRLNKTVPDQRNMRALKNNIKIIESLPGAIINIGSHSHAGGMRDIAGNYADTRSEYLKKEIQKYFDSKFLFSIDSLQKTESLINTCFDDPDCGRENEKLNGRSDLKIVSIGKI